MSAIIDFLSGIADGATAAIAFLVGLIEDIAYVAQSCAAVVASIPEYLGFFPQEILAALLAVFAIVVIYQLLGRN